MAWKRSLIWRFFPVTHSLIYCNEKAKESVLWRKSHWGSWNSWVSSVKVFSLGFPVIRSFIDFSVIGSSLWSPVIGSSKGSSVINSSLGLSVLFFRPAGTFFYQKVISLFLSKAVVLFYIMFSKRHSHLTISLTCCNKFQQSWLRKTWKNTCMMET